MVKVQGHGQIPSRSRAHVYAGGSGGRARGESAAARAGNRRRRAGDGARFSARCEENKSVSSNPGRGGKNFFSFSSFLKSRKCFSSSIEWGKRKKKVDPRVCFLEMICLDFMGERWFLSRDTHARVFFNTPKYVLGLKKMDDFGVEKMQYNFIKKGRF